MPAALTCASGPRGAITPFHLSMMSLKPTCISGIYHQ